MIKIAILCAIIGCAFAFRPYSPYYRPRVVKVVEKVEAAEPYEFSYSTTDEDGNNQARQESGDAHGNMKGSYSILGADGLSRKVTYVGDANGFRAVIDTNEPGTDGQNPADVTMNVAEAPVKVIAKPALRYKTIRVPVYGHYGY